jgi:hypothetical protein
MGCTKIGVSLYVTVFFQISLIYLKGGNILHCATGVEHMHNL